MASPKPQAHENAGRVIQFLGILGVIGIAGFLINSSLSESSRLHRLFESAEIIGLLVTLLVVTILIIIVGGAVRKHKEWARIVAMLYAAILLLGFPIGTIIGVYILWNLALKWKVGSSPT